LALRADTNASLQLTRDPHCLTEALDRLVISLDRSGREKGRRQPVRRHRPDPEQHLLGGGLETLIVVSTTATGVLHSARRIESVRGLVQEHFEHLRRRKVESLAGKQNLGSRLPVRDPAPAPPMPELHQPATLDAGAQDHNRIRKVGVMSLNVRPRGLAGRHDRARGGRPDDRLANGWRESRVVGDHRGRRWAGTLEQLDLDESSVGDDPVPHELRAQFERLVLREPRDDIVSKAQRNGRGRLIADLESEDRVG
jgi:hypothetical protein